jgi:CP family cyanate transporter-like MFS transporter
MGLQSMAYYVTLTWLPEILREEGMSAALAGWMLALNQAVGIVSMFFAPMLAARRPSQRTVVAAAVGLVAGGILGLLATDAAVTLWITLLGLGLGACFSLALTLFALRAPDSGHASALSGMAQSVGYMLAAAGPPLFGALRDAAHSWSVPLALLLAVAAVLMITGLGAARDAQVSGSQVS